MNSMVGVLYTLLVEKNTKVNGIREKGKEMVPITIHLEILISVNGKMTRKMGLEHIFIHMGKSM